LEIPLQITKIIAQLHVEQQKIEFSAALEGEWMSTVSGPDGHFELEFYGPLDPSQFGLPSIDPKLEAALLHRQDIEFMDVFVIAKRYPFTSRNGRMQPILAGLEPGFVVRDDGEIYSRERAPDEEDDQGKHKYLFAATVHPRQSNDPRRLLATDLMQHPLVEDVQLAPTLKRQDFSLPEIGLKSDISKAKIPIRGKGVVVGIVDYGCDFVHGNFRNGNGSTRLLYLWDQNDSNSKIKSSAPKELSFGREFDHEAIDLSLRQSEPYEALPYDPDENDYQPNKPTSPGTHGTHVMDIAAGNGQATGVPGVATGADLIFVQIRKFEFGRGEDLNRSRWAFEAAAYIFTRATDRPAAVNISLDTNSGPHDGTSPVEQAFDWLLVRSKETRPSRAIVVPAGNSWLAALHCNATIVPGSVHTLIWTLPAGEAGRHELEIWYECGNSDVCDLEVQLVPIDQQPLPWVRAGESAIIRHNGQHVGEIVGSRLIRRRSKQIYISLHPLTLDSMQCRIELKNNSRLPIEFHAWIERNDRGQSQFNSEQATRTCTLGSLACGHNVVVAGSYYAVLPSRRIGFFSSEGPTRDGREKPDISAPGVNIWAARSKGGDPRHVADQRVAPRVPKSGTSMAAPHVTGVIALELAKSPNLPIDKIHEALRSRARRDPPTDSKGWDSRYGYGRLAVRR
jgi:subtilisin family serine protease